MSSEWGRTRFDAEHELETARTALAAAEQRASALETALAVFVRPFVQTHGLSWMESHAADPDDARVAFVTELGPVRVAVEAWKHQRAVVHRDEANEHVGNGERIHLDCVEQPPAAGQGGAGVSGRCETCGHVGDMWCGDCLGPHPDDAVAYRRKLERDLATAALDLLATAEQERDDALAQNEMLRAALKTVAPGLVATFAMLERDGDHDGAAACMKMIECIDEALAAGQTAGGGGDGGE